MKPNLPIRYGGALTGKDEYKALITSIKKSQKTGNWQTGVEASKMEKEAAKFLGVKYGILTNSGSSAGLLALSALELPPGSEVIIPATTFPTIFNIILQCGLVPVVVDTKVGTYNIDVDKLEEAIGVKTKAIICVHAVGNPCDMKSILEIADAYSLYVIEDNCDGWGSSIGDRKLGSLSHISITSFHAAHIVSMGVGGGVFTNNPDLARNVRMYRDWGRQADTTSRNTFGLPEDYNPRFIYEKIGYNFQILELQAAMGRVQLRKSNKIKKTRKAHFDYLYTHLKKYANYLILPEWIGDVCWFAFPLSVQNGVKRGELTAYLEKKGIETRSMFAGNIIRHPAYSNTDYRIGNTLTGADYILHNSFWVSLHPRLTTVDLDYMVKTFDDFFA